MEDTTLRQWLNDLAAKQPTPGGGGAAALAAAVAAGLIGMVAVYTTGEKWAERSQRMQAISERARELRQEALGLMQADAEAFAKVGSAYALPKVTDAEKTARSKAIQDALVLAAEPPTLVVTLVIGLIDLAEELAANGNPAVISDVAVAAAQARTALEGAIVNIEINAVLIEGTAVKQGLTQVITKAEAGITKLDTVVQTVRQRIAA